MTNSTDNNFNNSSWIDQRFYFAQNEYNLEIQKNNNFNSGIGTLLSILAGATILAPFISDESLCYSNLFKSEYILSFIIQLIIWAALAWIYLIFTESVQNRAPLDEYLKKHHENTSEEKWKLNLIKTYIHAINQMRIFRKRNRKKVALAAIIVVILNFILTVL